MLEFKLRSQTPPHGFQWVDPDTGMRVGARSYALWIECIQEHRAANGLPAIDPKVAEDQNCQRLSAGAAREFCRSDAPAVCVDGVSLGLGDVVRGTRVIAAFKLAGSPLVSQEEAERRAAICAGCIRNSAYKRPCSGMCQELADVVTSIVGGKGTSRDGELEACSICKCANKAQVWVPIQFLKKGVTEDMMGLFPVGCWKRVGVLG